MVKKRRMAASVAVRLTLVTRSETIDPAGGPAAVANINAASPFNFHDPMAPWRACSSSSPRKKPAYTAAADAADAAPRRGATP